MVRITGLAPSVFDEHYWRHRGAYDKGEFHGVGFWRALAQSASISLSNDEIAELIQHDITAWTAIDPVMLDWAARLRQAGYRVAILSNMVKEIREHMESFDWLETFQQNTWLYELGISKPDAAIYRHALDQLDVQAGEALFIDDLEPNVRAAQAAGLHAVLFTTPSRLQADLNQLGLAKQLPPVVL